MPEKTKNPARIVSEVEYEYGLKPGTLASRDVSKFVSKARRDVITRLRSIGMSFPEIGAMLRRDHTSVSKLIARPVDKACAQPVHKKRVTRKLKKVK